MDAGGASMNKLTVELHYPVNEIVNHREHILHIRKSALRKVIKVTCINAGIRYTVIINSNQNKEREIP